MAGALRVVGRAHTTRHGYSIRAERFKAAIGNVALSALGPRDVDRLYAHWHAEGMSQAGVVHHHRVLRAALNQAKKWEWVDRNVALDPTVATPAPPELHVPSIEQTETLVLRAQQGASPDLGSIVLFAIMTGCRRGGALRRAMGRYGLGAPEAHLPAVRMGSPLRNWRQGHKDAPGAHDRARRGMHRAARR